METKSRQEIIIEGFETMLNCINAVEWYNKPKVFQTIVNVYKTEKILQDTFDYFPNERYYAKRFLRKGTYKQVFEDDGIDYFAPDEKGLYFVGEVHANPDTDEKFYWVKIGRGINLRNRMKNYNTSNPMLYRFDFSKEYDKEEEYQIKIMEKALAKCNHNDEWFLVDKETYLEMRDKGFKYFD